MWKQCSKCGKYKALYMFYKNKNSSLGLRSYCIDCTKNKNKDRYKKRKKRNYIYLYTKWDEGHQRKLREYRKNNVNKIREGRRKRRARENNTVGEFTEAEWQRLLNDYCGRCVNCGSKENIHRDHVISLHNGGSNYISNIQPLCKSCNSSKGKKNTDYRPYWLSWI